MALPPATVAEAEEESSPCGAPPTVAVSGRPQALAALPRGRLPPLAALPGGPQPLAALTLPGGPRPLAAVRGGRPPMAADPDCAQPLAALPGGPPPLAAVPGRLPPLAAVPGGAARPHARAPSTGGGCCEASIYPAGGSASVPRRLSDLHSAVLRFFRGSKQWIAEHARTAGALHGSHSFIGSRYWEQNPLPDNTIIGLNPVDFFSPHPVWEGFAVPVKLKGKTSSYYCTFCKKVFSGHADKAFRHMTNDRRKSCPISMQMTEELIRKETVFSQRRSDLKARKGKEVENTELINLEEHVSKLMFELSSSLGYQIEDGVLSMACLLLNEAEKLLERGIRPQKIAECYEKASEISFYHLQQMSEELKFCTSNIESLFQACMIALPSKMASNSKQMLVEIAVQAVLTVADFERHFVNLNLVQVKGKIGGKLADTKLLSGVVLDTGHLEMAIEIVDAKIAILTCKSEPLADWTKHELDIVERSWMLHEQEQEQKYSVEMIKKCKDVGATLVIFQWDFDKDMSCLLRDSNLPAIQCADDVDLQFIAIATGGKLVPKFQDLSPEDLGKAGLVRSESFGTNDQMLYIEQCSNPRAVTIFVCGGNEYVVEDVKRVVHDALCVLRNIFPYNSIGNSADLSCSIALEAAADSYSPTEKDVIRSFAAALDDVPVALAENDGLPSSDMLTREHAPHCGIVWKCTSSKNNKVLETTITERQREITLGTKVVMKIIGTSLDADKCSS